MSHKIIQLFCTFSLLASCSTMTKNLVTSGDVYFRGGVSKKSSWDSDLIFKRKSWYRDLTMAFDVLISPLSEKSDFFIWLSKSNQTIVRGCTDFKIYMAYTWDSRTVSYQEILAQLKSQGFQHYALPDFKRNLMMHPSYYPKGFSPYKIWGLCSKAKSTELMISIAGYKDTVVSVD